LRIRKREQDGENMIARTGQIGEDCRDRTNVAGQLG
jgi:hypothetical protein